MSIDLSNRRNSIWEQFDFQIPIPKDRGFEAIYVSSPLLNSLACLIFCRVSSSHGTTARKRPDVLEAHGEIADLVMPSTLVDAFLPSRVSQLPFRA